MSFSALVIATKTGAAFAVPPNAAKWIEQRCVADVAVTLRDWDDDVFGTFWRFRMPPEMIATAPLAGLPVPRRARKRNLVRSLAKGRRQ